MINKVILMGRLTADPEMRQTQSGISVARFSIAVDRRFQRQGEQKQTDFINCVAWRQQAEFVCRYFSKGKMIAIVGSLQQNNWKDKDGNNRTTYEVITEEISFADSKKDDSGSNKGFVPQETSTSSEQSPDNFKLNVSENDFTVLNGDDDLPF
jgi:single-strand DNA-binding protein